MNKILVFTGFLFLNFLALAIGGLSTSKEVFSDWYLNLNKAPWTPPGWVFGFAWTLVMLTFSVFMMDLFLNSDTKQRKEIFILYLSQWVLNVIWNPVFFSWHLMWPSLLIIVSLFIVLLFLYRLSFSKGCKFRYYNLPYLVWLVLAISLNAYAVLMN